MPLTETEKKAATFVARRFHVEKEPTTEQQLLQEFRTPTVINRLTQLRLWTVDSTVTPPIYSPTILTFYHCNDDVLLKGAKQAVTTVVTELKRMFETNFDQGRRYVTSDFVAYLKSLGYSSDLEQITFGLFLVKEVPNVIFASLDEKRTSVSAFQINQHILDQEPDRVWDNYIQTYDQVAAEDRIKAASEQQPSPPPREQAVAKKRSATPERNKADPWLPSRWRIVGSLGEGGQGWTYKVRRSGNSDQLYVLKRPKNKSRAERFRREIAALQKLQHPGILRIEEVSKESEEPFFVSEFCEGLDLAKVNLSRRTLENKLEIFRQVCDAIAVAHKMKILHRDLKPANIFIRKDGSVAVGDFGLCIDLTELRNRATETSEAVGARFYIAPELEDGRVDEPEASSDVYSLGKVLYFILSGRHLLREEYAEPEYELRSAGPGAEMHFVYEVFQKTVKRNPNERVQNAIALLETLDSVIQRVQLKAHALNISLPQRCVFCAVGAYSFSRSSVNSLQGICNTCGNVQDFIGQVGELWWEQK